MARNKIIVIELEEDIFTRQGCKDISVTVFSSSQRQTVQVIYDVQQKTITIPSIAMIGTYEMVMIAWVDGLQEIEIVEVEFTITVIDT